MAVVQNPIIGRTSGQAGGMVFTTQFGKNVMKAKAASVANPQSDAQMEQRSALTQIVAFYRLIATIIQAGFKSLSIGMSAYNKFASVNLLHAFTYSGAAPAVFVPTAFYISKGTIAVTPVTDADGSIGSEEVELVFSDSASGAGQSSTDKPLGVLWNETQNVWAFSPISVARSGGSLIVELPDNAASGDVVHSWLGFTSADGATQSDSVYRLVTID